MPLHETAGVPGHWSMETTPRYTHLIIEHKAELADRVLGSFSGVDRIGLQ